MFITFNKINGYIEDSLGIIKCLTLIPFEIKNIIKVGNNNWDNYDDQIIKIELKLNGNFHLGEKMKMYDVVITNNKSIFYGSNKCYPNTFLNRYFSKIG